ncbi:mas-related G-protein coupled receptor member A1-like [Liasis olivaceus]
MLKVLIFMTSYSGLLGNGNVIWILGFQIKRNPFTTFILILAIADFGFLISVVTHYIIFAFGDTYFLLCVCLNSSVNPVIYFLVGRTKRQFRESLRFILQKVFEEDS